MSDTLRICLAQLNPTVGALDANRDLIAKAYAKGKADGADLVVTPELSLIGYPPEDLVLKTFFVRQARNTLDKLMPLTVAGPALMVGLPWAEDGKLFNAVALLADGKLHSVRFKHDLPNYGVFDEKRVFDQTTSIEPISYNGFSLGAMICEDMWEATCTTSLSKAGIDVLLVPTCSPFQDGKPAGRLKEARDRVAVAGKPLLFCNQVGGQDELLFDGWSFVLDTKGTVTHELARFKEDSLTITLQKEGDGTVTVLNPTGDDSYDRLPALYSASVLALRDYIEKNRCPGVVLGLSGGIDSALSAAIAVDALGADRVHAVMLPTDYTSSESLEDAAACVKALGIRYDIMPIKKAVETVGETLADVFIGTEADTTEENIQSRLRGLLLMAISNKFGAMVLTTGNKSEVSVGYATLYGDMCGGYNAIKDIYKLDVFALSHWRNANVPDIGVGPSGEVIPLRIIEKPPSAELRPDQRDDDSLPPYEVLDPILKGLVEEDASVSDIVARGFAREDVERVEHLLYIAEYKRRQAAPGVKISEKLFGRDRRYPITNGFRTARFTDQTD